MSDEVKKGNGFLRHIHPNMIPEKSLKFTHTWGLGGMTAALILLQILTGMLLRFLYIPTPANAYDSILHIERDFMFGAFILNIHAWSGSLLIIVVFLHLSRVLFTGAYHGKRKLNWVIGVCLLFLIIFSNFTGYLLPWDQLAYWAVTVVSSMLSYIPFIGENVRQLILQGNKVGDPTLMLFYNLHTGILPLFLTILIIYHFWQVRKAGGVVVPGGEADLKKVPVIPNLVIRELAVALVLLAIVFLLAILSDSSLRERANPLMTPNPTKAPWYFLGVQELILHFHPFAAVFIIPLVTVVLLIALPFLKYQKPVTGVWFLSKLGRKTALISFLLAIILTPSFVLLDEFLIKTPGIFQNGIILFFLFPVLLTVYPLVLIKKYRADTAETVQSLFVCLMTSFIMLTLIGILFRGEGMVLSWP